MQTKTGSLNRQYRSYWVTQWYVCSVKPCVSAVILSLDSKRSQNEPIVLWLSEHDQNKTTKRTYGTFAGSLPHLWTGLGNGGQTLMHSVMRKWHWRWIGRQVSRPVRVEGGEAKNRERITVFKSVKTNYGARFGAFVIQQYRAISHHGNALLHRAQV